MYRERYSYFARKLEGKDLVGAEIGVYEGAHALGLLNNLDIKKLYLIDPYTTYANFFGGQGGIAKKKLINAQRAATDSTKGYANKIVWYFREAKEVLDDISNESLDFVYLDGNHSYENVILEIPAWEKKVKIGGLVGGHDYSRKHPGVRNAVNNYVGLNNIKLESWHTDWFYRRTK